MTSQLDQLLDNNLLEGLGPQVGIPRWNFFIYLVIFFFLIFFLGTNDKAGAPQFVQRWVSPQSIKETTVPYTDWSYPSVDK